MNRLRTHFADQQAQKAPRRLQSAIVRDYLADIVELIADDGATLSDVAAAVRAHGEPVLDHGFKAEILKQIGTVKNIRAGRAKGAVAPGERPTSSSSSGSAAPSTAPMATQIDAASDLTHDDDDGHFAARRPRG